MDLEEAREAIREIDREMTALFERRMRAAEAIAAYKKEHGLPITDPEQEKRVLERNTALLEDPALAGYYRAFQTGVMEVSKRYQRRLNEGMRVSYAGVEGAFAHIAARRIFPDANPVSVPSFRAAYDAVVRGESDAAVIPLENSTAGEVGEVMDLMLEGPLSVTGVYTLPVSQNLLGVPGASLSSIRRAVSHPQALSQCAPYLASHGITPVPAGNTAEAARSVAENKDPATAAVASLETAELYGLTVLERDINDQSDNVTKFAVFTPGESRVSPRRNQFILLFTVPDVAGALSGAISVIGSHGFNMKTLRSRPVRDRAWQYYFYTVIEGDETSEEGRAMLEALSERCERIRIAGHYEREIDLGGKASGTES